MIHHASSIASSYAKQGYTLTLRQLYYRFVAQGLIENNQKEYKKLVNLISNARYAGLFRWDQLVDRTRNLRSSDGWMEHPSDLIDPGYFSVEKWKNQPNRVEVWVEKDALVDVVSQAAGEFYAPAFSCRGYTSASEMWAAAQRFSRHVNDEGVENVVVIHLGDHDPSGIDMSRDIEARISEFMDYDGTSEHFVFKRIALNMSQVEEYNPPPNPAKTTDSRFETYSLEHGDESWELDALDPKILRGLICGEIEKWVDRSEMDAMLEQQERGRNSLRLIKDYYGVALEAAENASLD